jgi:ATP-dependent Lon protease
MSEHHAIELPLLPLRDVVVYPHMVLPLFVGRERSIEALENAMANDKQVLLVAQRNAGGGRSRCRRHLPGGHRVQHPAAAQAA